MLRGSGVGRAGGCRGGVGVRVPAERRLGSGVLAGTAAPNRGSGAQGRDPTVGWPAREHPPGAGFAETERQPPPYWEGEGGSRAGSAEAQRRDADREAARQPRALRTGPWVWPWSPHQFRARGGAGNGPEWAAVPEERARPRASCHSPFEMLDDLLFPHILR